MKFSVPLKDLKAELARCASLPGMSQASAVLLEADSFGGLFIQRNTILASMRVNCDATVEQDGTAAVSYDSLRVLVGRCAGKEIAFEIKKEGHVAYKSGSATGNLKIWPLKDMPKTIPPVSSEPVEFPNAEQLGRWLKIAGEAAWKGDGRPNLEGACIRSINGRLAVLGSDGRRIHACLGGDTFNYVMPSNGVEYDPGILIKGDMLRSIEACLDGETCKATLRAADTAQIEVGSRWVRFCYPKDCPPDMSLYMKPTKREVWIKVDRLQLLQLIRSASGLSHIVQLDIDHNFLVARAQTAQGDDFNDEIAASASKKGILTVNADYMTDFLDGLSGETIEMTYDREYHALFCEEADRWFMFMTIRSSDTSKKL